MPPARNIVARFTVHWRTPAHDDYENIRKISRQVCDGGEAWNYWTDLKYDKMGRLWRVLESERPPGGSVESVAAREFRYAGARQRYLTRQLDPSTLDPIPGTDVWSDYLGDSIYGDYTLAGSTATMTRRYVPGEWQTDVQAAATSFFHTNMLGTTRMLSDNLGTAIPDTNRLYTAYGVPIAGPTSPTTRYGYAGAWGYQEHGDLPLLHIGTRYYDPHIGRFLQRDLIGILGGLNVYGYVEDRPLNRLDPDGMDPFEIDGVEMPDPDSGGSLEGKRRQYYRRRMHQLGYQGCTWANFLAPWHTWNFVAHTYMVHEEVMVFYPDPPPHVSVIEVGPPTIPFPPKPMPSRPCTRGCHNDNQPW